MMAENWEQFLGDYIYVLIVEGTSLLTCLGLGYAFTQINSHNNFESNSAQKRNSSNIQNRTGLFSAL